MSFIEKFMHPDKDFKVLKEFNEAETQDWGDDYRVFAEEVMNMPGTLFDMMYKFLNGAQTMWPYANMYQYKVQ